MKTRLDESRKTALKQINISYHIALAQEEKAKKDFNNNVNVMKKHLLTYYQNYLEQRKGMALTIRQKWYGKAQAVSEEGIDFGNYFSNSEEDIQSLKTYQYITTLIKNITDFSRAEVASKAIDKVLNPGHDFWGEPKRPHGRTQPTYISGLLKRLDDYIAPVQKVPGRKLESHIFDALGELNDKTYDLVKKFYPEKYDESYDEGSNFSAYDENKTSLRWGLYSSTAIWETKFEPVDYEENKKLELNVHGILRMERGLLSTFKKNIEKQDYLPTEFEWDESEALSLLSAPVSEPSAPSLLSSAARVMSVVGISPSVKESEEVEDQPGLLKSAEKIAEIEKIRTDAFKLDESLAVYDEYQPGLRVLR